MANSIKMRHYSVRTLKSYVSYTRSFQTYVGKSRHTFSTAADGLAVALFIDAVIRSSGDGGWVQVGSEQGEARKESLTMLEHYLNYVVK